MADFERGFDFLLAQSALSLISLFWYTIIFEFPRYGIAFLAVAVVPVVERRRLVQHASDRSVSGSKSRISVLAVGHNEAGSIERCVRSLRAQSLTNLEIIVVSDGSSDAMSRVATKLTKEGLVDRALATDLRGGKSSGVNLAIHASTGNIIVNVDCDCSYDRFAIENAVRPFDDPSVGAVCGDIIPRNGDTSLIARFQEIEYLHTISVGKRIAAAFGQVVCVSGAFGAFRREALASVGNFDVGGGEDLDLTLRLRSKGWRVEFAEDAVCYTDVPETLWGLIRQRFRWERDAIWLRFRKHWRLLHPGSSSFRIAEAVHQWDYLIFNVAGAIIFPFYIAWLYQTYGTSATTVLVATQVGLVVVDTLMLAIAARVAGRPALARNLPYMLGYSFFASYIMRFVRLWAYIEEFFLFGSRRDNYVPAKVRAARPW
ncbi:MAG: glycosyltransferase family 2 protein [Hyphomicrobiales bacterium]|nr:glycosyltransferase family 2 protein [Hyphomicrobiales bacterium]